VDANGQCAEGEARWTMQRRTGVWRNKKERSKGAEVQIGGWEWRGTWATAGVGAPVPSRLDGSSNRLF
jgi:hypothetical protein